MSSIAISTALSGISAANERLRASAHNTANLSTSNMHRQQVQLTSLPTGGVEATTSRAPQPGVIAANELVEQQSATYAFVANLKVLQTQLRAEGALLDIKA